MEIQYPKKPTAKMQHLKKLTAKIQYPEKLTGKLQYCTPQPRAQTSPLLRVSHRLPLARFAVRNYLRRASVFFLNWKTLVFLLTQQNRFFWNWKTIVLLLTVLKKVYFLLVLLAFSYFTCEQKSTSWEGLILLINSRSRKSMIKMLKANR